jgi:hypothetical protein
MTNTARGGREFLYLPMLIATCLRAAYEGWGAGEGGERQPLQGSVTGTSLSIK